MTVVNHGSKNWKRVGHTEFNTEQRRQYSTTLPETYTKMSYSTMTEELDPEKGGLGLLEVEHPSEKETPPRPEPTPSGLSDQEKKMRRQNSRDTLRFVLGFTSLAMIGLELVMWMIKDDRHDTDEPRVRITLTGTSAVAILMNLVAAASSVGCDVPLEGGFALFNTTIIHIILTVFWMKGV
ncbi:hypothetical protein HDK77DRAFT_435700 [Phyllosticta capitalensis]